MPAARRLNRRASLAEALGEQRDDQGRLVVGSTTIGCLHCGAPPVSTISACNRVAYHHPPTNCCNKARAKNQRALEAGDREMKRAEDDRKLYYASRGETQP